MTDKPLYHCVACNYTGRKTGWIVQTINRQTFASCPNGCEHEEDIAFADAGDLIPMLEYDAEDDSVPMASNENHATVLAAFHKFLATEKKPAPVIIIDLSDTEHFEENLTKLGEQFAKQKAESGIVNLAKAARDAGLVKQQS